MKKRGKKEKIEKRERKLGQKFFFDLNDQNEERKDRKKRTKAGFEKNDRLK